MPRDIHWRGSAWRLLLELPEQLRRDALSAVGALMAAPLPPEAAPYAPVPDTYRLDTGYVTVFYRLVGDEIDIVYIRANS